MATEEIEEENPKKKLNKSGNRRGIDTKGNFKNDSEKASEASKKANKRKGAATQAITRSPAIKEAYRSRAITPEIQGYIFNQLQAKKLKRILLCATGALMSPTTAQQNESILGIAHAVSIEV